MPLPPKDWTPFVSEEERLAYLKAHKLTPPSFREPKPLFYSGIDAEGSELCTAEGIADSCTLVIRIGEEYHCIHPDYLAEMQAGRGSGRRSGAPRETAPKKTAPKAGPTGPDIIAIDFETATGSYNSACSLGIAVVRNLQVVETWYHLICPPGNRYEDGNVQVHGIAPAQTEGAPTLDDLWPEISRFFDGTLVAAHNAKFDISVLRRSLRRSGEIPDFTYADTLTMVKNVVPGRHGLDACCDYFGITLEHHHNALDDARACAEIACACARLEGCSSVRDYLKKRRINPAPFHRKENPYNRYASKAVRVADLAPTVEQFDLTHPLYQKTLAFTGDLAIDRAEAMQLALNRGANVKSGVSAKVDILVIGRKGEAPGAAPSSKERKARELTAGGKANIRLMEEDEFMALVK